MERIYHIWPEAFINLLNMESFHKEFSFELEQTKSLAYFHGNGVENVFLFSSGLFSGAECFKFVILKLR